MVNKNISINNYNSKITQYEFSISSYENLIQEWTKFRSSYPDIIEPLLSNVAEFLYGFRMKVSLLKKLVVYHEYLMIDVDIQEDMTNFIKFPVLDNKQTNYQEHLDLFTNKNIRHFVEKVLHDPENPFISKQAIFRYVTLI